MMTMTGHILKSLMFQQNLKTAKLARAAGIPQQTLQRLVNGITPHPHTSTLEHLAHYFSLSLAQLRGEEPIPELSNPPSFSNIRSIPVIPQQELTQWPMLEYPKHCPKIYVENTLSENAFALRVWDASMEPVFRVDTILIVDPSATIKDRCYAIVVLRELNVVTFRQLIIDLTAKYLKSLSPDFQKFPLIELTSQDIICGVVTQARYDYT